VAAASDCRHDSLTQTSPIAGSKNNGLQHRQQVAVRDDMGRSPSFFSSARLCRVSRTTTSDGALSAAFYAAPLICAFNTP
jgi:hypothetical protein